jgi:hypothetical protein
VLAASFVADQAAAVATFGLAEAALAAIELAARKAIEFLEQQLEQFILAQVIEAGFKALQPIIQRALDGFVFQAASAALGGPAGGGGAVGSGFQVIPEELRSHAQVLHSHADTVASHAQTLTGQLTGVSFA